jgi:hypothetical protein
MSAPDFYFAVNAIFRHVHERHGKEALVDYWRRLAQEYYAERIAAWQSGGLAAVAADWRSYFAQEPLAEVEVLQRAHEVELVVRVCPAIKHLRDHGREIVPYYCEHCDHTCGVLAEAAGLTFQRSGGMGACCQRFVQAGAADGEVR